VSGNNNINRVGAFGTKGVSSVSNYPGSRKGCYMVFHPSSNCLFVFGGLGLAATTTLGMCPVISRESFKFVKDA